MRIGAHVSTAGGLDKAIDRALELGAETIQIFGSPPQSWFSKPYPAEQIRAFKEKAAKAQIGPTFLHGVYLVNLATENPENLAKSIHSLTTYLHLAAQIEALGVIFHVGSHRGIGFEGVLGQIVASMRRILEETPPQTWLVIENNAGQGQQVGASFGEIATLRRELASPRIKVCLDTCHTLASGYQVTTVEGLEATMAELDREIGVANLVAVHANDSKSPLNSNVDRHANIGEGYIGTQGFEVIMSHPAFRDVPFLLEVPGFDGKGPDRENVERLRALRQRVGLG